MCKTTGTEIIAIHSATDVLVWLLLLLYIILVNLSPVFSKCSQYGLVLECEAYQPEWNPSSKKD